MAVFTTIGAAIFGAGTFMAGLTAAALQVAAGIGMSLIGKALAGEPEQAKFGVQVRLQGGDDTPRSILFGYNCTAGSLVYGNSWGVVNKLPNAYLTQVIALADYPIREVVRVEVNGSPVTLLSPAHAQFGFPVEQFRRNGVDHLWVKIYDGTQTAPDSFLVNSVSSAERPFPNSSVGYGIPYVITTAMAHERKDEEEALFTGGFPTFKFVTNGAKLYDISRDSTAGGSGSQRWNNPATWGGDGDHLAAVQIYNLLRGIRFGNQWLYGLQNLPSARLPNADWVRVINKCRALIDGPNGQEATYRTGGEIQVGAQVKFAIESILTGSQGRLSEVGGVYKLHVGEPDSPVMSFTDSDIISTEEQSFTPFYSLEDTINGIQAKYPNPDEGWNTKTAPPLIRTDLELLDGNRRLMADVSLDMVPYKGQVQRLMKSALLEAQRARRHTLVLGPEFWILEPGDVIQWSSERNGYENKLFRVDGLSDRPNLDVMIDITEVDPSDYDWNQSTDYKLVIDGPLQLVDTPALPLIGWQVYATSIQDQQGRPRRPAIEIWYQSGIQDVQSVKFQVRRFGQTEIFLSGEVPYGFPWKTIIGGDFPPDSEFEVRGIFVRASGGKSSWSDWLYVKTLPIKLIGGLDYDPYGDIDLDSLNDDLKGYLGWLGENTREILRQAQELATASADEAFGNFSQRAQIRRELALSVEGVRANYLEAIDVAIGPNSALASRLESLEAAVGDDIATAVSLLQTQISEVEGLVTSASNAITLVEANVDKFSASGLFRAEVVATQQGALSTIGLSAAATGNGPPSASSLLLSAIAGGLSRLTVIADEFVVSTPAGPQNPLIYDGTGLRLNVANIGTINAGILQGTSVQINLNTGFFSFG